MTFIDGLLLGIYGMVIFFGAAIVLSELVEIEQQKRARK